MANDGLKDDDGKLLWDLLPFGAVEAIVRVMTHGARKYAPGNWRDVEPHRYFAALMRHLAAVREGEDIDPDSGLPHLAHVATNALFLLAQHLGTKRETHERA